MKRLWIVLTALMIVSIVLSAFAAAEEFSVGAETISTGETAAAELIDEIPGEAPDVVLGGEDGEGAASLVTLRAAASGEVEPTCQEYSVGGNKFLYSDEMLLGDAREFSSDLAKISVALAEAAYRKDGIKDLEKLGYAVDQTSYDASYSRVTKKPNDGGMTLYDNDYVAYSIWRKDYGDYTFYIIPVKGTSANLEWFSDFNLGNTSENNGYHEGFYKAASRAWEDITDCFDQHVAEDSTRVVLFTGHSRGAAVANLLAGWMTDNQTYVSQSHLFCYTFACPSVGHANVVSNYSNIRNFNNAGDLIPLLPLETGVTAGWNFSRYGRTFDQNLTGLENFNRLFTNKWGDAYLGQASETNYNNLIKSIIPEESSYEEKHWALDLLSYYVFGGKDYTTWDEFLHYMVTRHGIDIVKFIGKQTTIGKLADFAQRLENRRQEWEEQIELIQALQDALADPGDKTEEEIFEEHRAAVEIVKTLNAITTNPTMSQINLSVYLLQEMIDESISTFEGGWGLVSLFCDSSFKLQDAIYDGHEPHTYLFWINSKYAGCDSWSGTDIKVVPGECVLGDCTSIGARAFSGCTSLRGIPIPEELRYIGDSAFSGCSGATGEIAFPNSLRYIGSSAFSGCSGITGKLEFSNALQYVGSSAFYNCSGITGAVTFSDGLEFIGENAFNGCAGIETLVVPDTAKIVGNASFANCPGLKSLTIPVEMLNLYGAFYVGGTTKTTSVETLHLTAGTTGKMYDMTSENYGSGYINGVTYQSHAHLQTVILGEGITHVGNYAFYGCSKITSVSLPSTLESVGHYAFQNVSQW
ncbi:MAG: leucine-rich repeat protein, partial [Clostridia bacterium]|nr:leucine-rich repeat protein [Clostridia bacterium]